VATCAAAAVTLLAGVGLGYTFWPRGDVSASTVTEAVATSTSPRVVPSAPGMPASSVAGSATARGGVQPAATGSRAGGSAASVTPLPKPSSLPSAVVLPWAGWKQQAATVCRSEQLPLWAAQLTHGSDAAAADPTSKRYAVQKLGTGASDFYTVLSGLGVSGPPADRIRRSDLLAAVKQVADTARGSGSAPSTSAAWQQVTRAFTTESIVC
jgi:hypothetical protein